MCASQLTWMCLQYIPHFSLAVLSSVKFKVKYLTTFLKHSSIDLLQIYFSDLKTIENIFPVMN